MADKKIALLLGQAEENYQQEFMKGVTKQAGLYGYDVCVFAMYIKYQNTKEREIGDSNIYNLINYDLFSGIIILSDTIQTPGVEKSIEEKIRERFDGPVVCVDIDSPYFHSFWTDGYEAVYAEISHLIEEHDITDIAYLTGRRNHVHSQRRLEAYRKALEDHNIQVKENRILYGDFWYTSGAGCAENLLRDRDNLPQAMVCANDCMAIGFASEMEKEGIRIPEDIVVAGYGTSSEGQHCPKSLTSTYIPAQYYGSYSVEIIMAEERGVGIPEQKPSPKIFLGGSCGCDNVVWENGKKIHDKGFISYDIRDTWMTDNSEEGYFSIHNNMVADFLQAATFEELFKSLYETIFYLRGVKRMEICLNHQWLEPDALLENDFPTVGYTDKVINILSYDSEDGARCRVGEDRIIDSSSLISFKNDDVARCYTFVPLYLEDKSFGYAMVGYGKEEYGFNEVNRLWLNEVVRGLESYRRLQVINIIEKKNAIKLPTKMAPVVETEGKRLSTADLELDNSKELAEVEKILDENLLTYHFQPIVNSIDGEIYSYEALMRSNSGWNIPPLQIIKLADVMGRLNDIEKATFVNVLNLVEENKELFKDKKVFINSIPGCRLEYNDFVRVEKLLKKNSGTAVVELTEQAELSEEEINELKVQYEKMGIGLAIDDYGTGYSNVSNLLRYMPGYVKIDRSLLSEIQNSSQKQHFVREIIDFCHANNIMALAEGVETTEELSMVISLGADLIQGYYIARPAAQIITTVDANVKAEIVRYHREREDGASEQSYMAGRTNRISINTLIKENKTSVVIGDKNATFRDITIVGTPNTVSNIHVEVLDGFEGKITFENVTLSTVKQRPCIDIAGNSNVTLSLIGENHLRGGGIRVPETSSLTFEGDGNIKLQLDGNESYGIGNAVDKAHGSIKFYQDGCIFIDSKGQTLIGIGSGLGGDIQINKGKYVIEMSGDEGVGIGSLHGELNIKIHDCDLMVESAFYKGVCIGSLEQNVDIDVWRTLLRCTASGKTILGLGSIEGEKAKVYLHDLTYFVSLRAEYATGLGCLSGTNDLIIDTAAFKYKGAGRKALVYGGYTPDATVRVENADVGIKLISDSGILTYAPKENIKESNLIKSVVINDEIINR